MTELGARGWWLALEPVHAVVYFNEGCQASMADIGLRGFWMGYFAGRAAPLGPAGPEVVTATCPPLLVPRPWSASPLRRFAASPLRRAGRPGCSSLPGAGRRTSGRRRVSDWVCGVCPMAPGFSPDGVEPRRSIEAMTDYQAGRVVAALDDRQRRELLDAVRPVTAAVHAPGVIAYPNPMVTAVPSGR